MIEKLKNYWADDEIRPAIQLLAAFIVVSTAFLWWCFPGGSLLGFVFVSALLCIPFAYAFNVVTNMVFDRKDRLRTLEITGVVVLVLGSAMMMESQQKRRDERMMESRAGASATSANQQVPSPQVADEPEISRSTILIGISWMMIYGGYRLSHWSVFRQGELSVTDPSS